ncbi:hypothetical protein I4641_20555 [Waterburya agarophytonicola K14]|uniref:Ribbon-helix-helix protein CopG domain-containing protein n=1 Tax=Waterburya agarophytonicola KI4 TaxID=2874699 RepID=A0A964BYC5_9CYAN|nr:hypothetical protein [Waterburya agarophytonicola]MCC0179356.1 hypothetical protein [Waterburya agarophytonicola KI4]
MARKKLSDAQKQFIAGDDMNTQASQQVLAEANTQVSTEISDRIGADLKQELFSDRKTKESSIRFTVDIPESLNKRLAQLSVDTGKPKTELVRTIIDRALTSLDY